MKKTFFASALLAAAYAHAAGIATQLVNYQGQLTTPSGLAVGDGNYNMAFEVYSVPSGGLPLWTSALSNVAVTKGLFNVELDLSSIAASDLNGSLYLQVTVAGETLNPRKRLLASAFSLNANALQGRVPGTSVGDIPFVLGTGKLDPSLLSAPFPLVVTGTGAGYASFIENFNVTAGQAALKALGFDGVSATAASAGGAGLIGYSSPTDNATARGAYGKAIAGIGVQGASVSGIGVKAEANTASNTGLHASNPLGLGAYASGVYGLGLSASQVGLQVGGSPLSGQSFSNPLTGIAIQSAGTGITIVNAGSGSALDALNSGNGDSIRGRSSFANGVGVFGEHIPVSGFGVGVRGQSNSADGHGLEGLAPAAAGANVGVYGSSGSSAGFGVYGTAPLTGVRGAATAAGGFGAYGLAQGAASRGVQGESTGSGDSTGVYGIASSSQGRGVYGESPRYGVQGVSSAEAADSVGVAGSAPLNGVLGEATKNSGASAVGVIGRSFSPQGTGLLGEANAAGSGPRFGVVGRSTAGIGTPGTGVYGIGNGVGVKGEVPGTAANQYGVFGHAQGSGNFRAGVYGTVDSSAAGEIAFGILGEVLTANNSAYGIYANNTSAKGRALHAFNSNSTNGPGSTGYALGVTGKFEVTDTNAGLFSFSGTNTQWTVSSQYCSAGDVVLISPAVDISAGGTQANSLWVQQVTNGSFTVRSAAPVTNLSLHYFIISK